VLYGAFIDGALVAVAELHPLTGAFTGAGEAEAAFSVERAYQDLGIGTELFRRLTTAARNRGIRRIVLHCLPGNARMQHICAKFDARITFADGEACAVMDAAAPTPLSIWVEAVADGTSLAKALLDAELTLLRVA
jgi:GNAT superfamily N-acetyltransferase